MKRSIFFVSDGTGITAEALGQSLLTQFEDLEFEQNLIPFVKDRYKAEEVAKQFTEQFQETGNKPIVFSTLVNSEIRTIIENSPVLFLDFFKAFISPLENELGVKSSSTVGKRHGMANYNNYMQRINAVNYTLSNDDGANIHNYDEADIIIVGVSRCGKTPTSLYLALQYGLYTANYPFTEDDFSSPQLPKHLLAFKHKLFGLTIDPLRLQHIRQERRPDSQYAALKQCQFEVREAENIFRQSHIPYLDSTRRSVEEIATEMMAQTGIKRKVG